MSRNIHKPYHQKDSSEAMWLLQLQQLPDQYENPNDTAAYLVDVVSDSCLGTAISDKYRYIVDWFKKGFRLFLITEEWTSRNNIISSTASNRPLWVEKQTFFQLAMNVLGVTT